jgi:hypothetical protein
VSKPNITDLRKHLFETLAELRDPDKPMAIERAREIANVAKVVIETAKVEVAFLKVRGAAVKTSEFLLEEGAGVPAERQIASSARPSRP